MRPNHTLVAQRSGTADHNGKVDTLMPWSFRVPCTATITVLLLIVPSVANSQTHPRQYVRVYEARDDSVTPTRLLGREMDIRNNILVLVTLFDNTLHLSYGWNLNVESKRRYFGVGFSFFNLSQRVGGLIAN